MPAYFYAKLHHTMLYDPSWGMLDDYLWRKRVELEILANETPENDTGELPPVNVISWKLRLLPDATISLLEQFEKLNIVTKRYKNSNESLHHGNESVTWFLNDFADRQRAATGVERQAHFRARKQQNSGENAKNSNEPLQKRNEPVTNRCNINININDIYDDEFHKLWNLLFTKNDIGLKKGLIKKYTGEDMIARMRQWAEAIKSGECAETSESLRWSMIANDSEPPAPERDQDLARAVEISQRQARPQPSPAEELWGQMQEQLQHRKNLLGRFTPVDLNGKLVLSCEAKNLDHARRLQNEFNAASQMCAAVDVEFVSV